MTAEKLRATLPTITKKSLSPIIRSYSKSQINRAARSVLTQFSNKQLLYVPIGPRCAASTPQHLGQALMIDRFCQMMIEAGLCAALKIAVAAPTGLRHQLHIAPLRHGTNLPRQVVAVHPGQANIDERGIRGKAAECSECARCVISKSHFAAPELQ